MSIEEIHRSGGLVLSTDTNDDDPKEIFMVECRECSAMSNVVDDTRLPVEVWTLKHTEQNPGHDRYRLTTDSFWSVKRGSGRPRVRRDRSPELPR
ncbi:hypothetical protein ACFXKS_02880 [Streptomyces scopuliridis]|uniref:DUF7848 domain-containing protein n=1 Tax=Streptomyces scopuliridis TaxID=452529 RepID=UPI003688010C